MYIKQRIHSSFLINIDDQLSGKAIVNYQNDCITCEIIFFPNSSVAIFNEKYKSFEILYIDNPNDRHSVKLMNDLVNGAISNRVDVNINFQTKREVYRVTSQQKEGQITLINDFSENVNQKQAIIHPSNEFVNFPIDMEDIDVIEHMFNNVIN